MARKITICGKVLTLAYSLYAAVSYEKMTGRNALNLAQFQPDKDNPNILPIAPLAELGYCMLIGPNDLEKLGIGLRRYIEILEQSIIETVAEYGIEGRRLEGATGVWLCDEAELPNGEKTQRNWRKVCAIGVKASRFVTMHGLALNASTDLKWFTMINPCGFIDKGVTSISKELGREVSFEEASKVLCEKLLANFKLESEQK